MPSSSPLETILTLDNAGFILTRYLQAFGRHPSTFKQTITYTTVPPPSPPIVHPPPTGPSFHALLTLPPGAGLDSCHSLDGPYTTKLMAKRSALYSACRQLREKGELDDGFQPTPNGQAPSSHGGGKKVKIREGRDPAKLARWVDEGDKALEGDGDEDLQRGLSMSRRWELFKGSIKDRLPEVSPSINGGPAGIGVYETIVGNGWGKVGSRRMWLTTVKLDNSDGRALGMLTADQVVNNGEVGLEVESKTKGEVRMVDAGRLKKLSEEQYDLILRYTERAIRSILNKNLHLPDTPYWFIVPLIRDYSSPSAKRSDIDWEEISSSLGPLFSPVPTDTSALDDAIVASNPSEFGRKYYIDSVSTLTPSSPHPDDPSLSILQYSFRRTSPPPNINLSQSILIAYAATSGRSGGILSPSSEPNYLIPELNHLYAFPASTYRTLSILPLFFIALDDHLTATQLNSTLFDNALNPKLALQAITAPISKPLRPECTYERLEILGDTLIKLISTVDTCLRGPLDDNTRVERHVLVSNSSLRANGVAVGVPKYIRISHGKAKTWEPQMDTAKMVNIGDKIIADVVEALVGAAYLSSHRSLDAAIFSMKRLHIPIDRVSSWADVTGLTSRNSLEIKVDPAEEDQEGQVQSKAVGWIKAFTKPVDVQILGYTFRNKEKADAVLNVSLRPRQDAQQFKMIGDAILDFFVIEKLFDLEEMLDPAAITNMKHSRAADQSLAAMTVHLDLTARIEGMDVATKASVDRYIGQLQARGKKKKEFWAGMSYVSTLGAIPEILLGAIFSDQNGDLTACRTVFDDHFWPFVDKYGIGATKHSLHPKSVMQERLFAWGCMKWEIVRVDSEKGDQGVTCLVLLHDVEIARGTAESQALATRGACERVVEKMTEEKVKEICTCSKG